MPVVSLTLEDTNRTILANTYFKIIQDIVDTVKIPYGALVVLHKDSEVTLTDNKTNATLNTKDNLPSTVSSRRVQASINEDFNEDELTTTAVHQPAAYPIFLDPDVDVSIYPIYVKSDITINFTYVSPSKIEANRIRDDIRLRLSQTRNIDIHEIEYSILIPEIVEEFIADVYDLKNRLVPQSLEDYFREHSTKRIFPMTDMSNKENTKLAVQEKQVRIVGVYDFSSMPEKVEHDNENSNFKVSFSYRLSMEIPRAIAMRYPVMICNRPLPAKYIQFIEDNKRNSKEECNKNLNYTGSLRSLSHFEAHRQLENRIDIKLPMNIPAFDEFNLRQGHKGYGILVSFLTQVNEDDKRSLFNLRDLDEYYIPEPLLEFLKNGERNFVTKPYMSFLYFGLHQGTNHYDNSILEIDSDLNVKSKVNLSLMKPVRVTISMSIDLSYLDKNCINRLFDNPEILFIFLNEYINAYNNFKTEQSNSFITDNTFYRDFILMLYRYLGLDKFDIIKKMFQILSRDNYLYSNILNLLKGGYFDIYRSLVQKDILQGEVYDGEHRRSEVDSLVMKTAMINYVVAGRRDS